MFLQNPDLLIFRRIWQCTAVSRSSASWHYTIVRWNQSLLQPMMHIAYSTAVSTKFINFPLLSKKFINFPSYLVQFTFFGLIYVFLLPLFWPWCIYASSFTRTGCHWLTETKLKSADHIFVNQLMITDYVNNNNNNNNDKGCVILN